MATLFGATQIAKKYLSEFNGVKGIKKLQSQNMYLQKILTNKEQQKEAQQLAFRVFKGLYINHRLLYQVRLALATIKVNPSFPSTEHQQMEPLNVRTTQAQFSCYFPDQCPARDALLKIRRNQFGCSVLEHIKFMEEDSRVLQEEIQKLSLDATMVDLDKFMDQIVINMRKHTLKDAYPNLRSYSLGSYSSANLSTVSLPAVPGNLLVLYSRGGKKEGIYVPHLPLRFTVEPKGHIPAVINENGWNIYEINRWIEQLDKGNPNITEFLISSSAQDCTFLWMHEKWKEFIETFKQDLITTSSVNGAFIAVQQTAKKLQRGGKKVSKRK